MFDKKSIEFNHKKRWKFNYANKWRVDVDYWPKLTDLEKEYLFRFLGEYYQGCRFKDFNIIEDKKESYTRNNSANRDVMTKVKRSDFNDFPAQTIEIEKDIIFEENTGEI